MYKILNSSQHHIITKEKHICDICIPYIQGNTYVCVYLNHFPVHLKLMQHCKSTRLQLKKKKKNGSWFSISGPGPSGAPGAPSDPAPSWCGGTGRAFQQEQLSCPGFQAPCVSG